MPDSTGATIALLRQLRHGHARKQVTSVAYWLYAAGLVVLVYGGWLIAVISRALRHPPPPVADAAALLRAAPAGLGALAVLVVAALLWDARWHGPVTVSQPTADWLLDTPVRRERLLCPRYRAALLLRVLVAAAAGLVPAALLLSAGLGHGGPDHSVPLAGVAMLSTALLAGLGTGIAASVEARHSARPARAATGSLVIVAVACAVLATLAATVSLPPVVGAVLLWSGPWGWAAQGPVALAGGNAPLWWAAIALLAATAVAAMVAGDRAAGRVPAAALRARARTLGSMSAATSNLDLRRIGTAYRAMAGGYGRVRFTVRPPLRRELVLPWRDLVALVRAPARLVAAVAFALAAVLLGALAVHAPHAGLLPLAGALVLGYLAAAGLCEGARLDADDVRRSGLLPFRYDALVWRHAIVPCLVLAIAGGLPAAAAAVVTGRTRLLPVLGVFIAVLVGGALLNAYRGPLEAEALAYGFETPFGNTGAIVVARWYLAGPLLSVGPLIVLGYLAISGRGPGAIVVPVILALGLAALLGRAALRRARELRSR